MDCELHDIWCKIADLTLLLKLRYPHTARQCKDYICPKQENCDLELFASDEQVKSVFSSMKENANLGAAESLCIYRALCKALPSYNSIMFHSSVLAFDNEGYGFFGLSGAGKSTHTKLWLDLLGDKVRVVNGDKPIFKVENEKIFAYGTPWCGKEGLQSNMRVPLKALCKITKAKENKIIRLEGRSAAESLISQVILPDDEKSMAKTLEILNSISKSVKIYELFCNISEDAARLSFETMKGELI